tara:strand:- start:1621 stop:1794 length:174 start_codon:yes stop_codon:yes gene_type:complete
MMAMANPPLNGEGDRAIARTTVRPELVEGPCFFPDPHKEQGFDRLSPNGSQHHEIAA